MSNVKIQKLDNSFGFKVSKNDLEVAEFDIGSDYELLSEKGSITLVKKPPLNQTWEFPDPELTRLDQDWLNAEMGEGDDK